ncbi:MAG TPA: Rap1a/Tai family immunity protein [Gammaproteobacteria bacterium]|nr:Rap1a/Tai family immunity protein [Gammaproteobacteria bacterium]
MKNVFATGLVSLALLLTPQHEAMAVEPLSAVELASHCKHLRTSPEGIDSIFCIRYVQGFIDGAIATDERVTLNVAEEYHKEETFSERATRIRLGQRLASYGGSYFAEFCLGEPSPLAEVVAMVASSLEQDPPDSDTLLARNVVYKTLREQYPCARED